MADCLWTSSEIAEAVDGRVTAPFTANGVSIDTRTLQAGDLFVPLSGVRDGHEFAPAAFSKGAAGALAAKDVDGPSVVVKDIQTALERLGAAARDRAPARRCAVTGSVGKTSVTQAIASALTLAGPSHNSVLSYNNHIGVPLTLARMPRQTRYAVFEIGMNHTDEIRPLTRMVRPHVAVVTMVGAAHAENFADGEKGIALAKAEIFEGLEPGGVAVLNADNPWFEDLAASAKAHGAVIKTFGRQEKADARLNAITGSGGGSWVSAHLHGQALDFPLAQKGEHWGLNSLATILAVEALGAPIETALQGLAGFEPLAGRGQSHQLTIDGKRVLLVDESYNANPISMGAALATLKSDGSGGRKIAVLTDMLELGGETQGLHAALAEPLAAAGVDQVFLAGSAMRALWAVLPDDRKGSWRQTAEALAPDVLAAIRSGDVVMAKGSKGSKASFVVEALISASNLPDHTRAGGAG